MAAVPGHAQDFNTPLEGLGRALAPEEERERAERRRYDKALEDMHEEIRRERRRRG